VYCSKCGTALTEGGVYCSGCGAIAASAAPAPPAASPASPLQVGWTPQSSVAYAGFWLRFVAYLIDQLVLGIPLLILFAVLIVVLGLSAALQGLHPGESPDEAFAAIGAGVIFLGIAVFVVASWLYFALCESSTWQATPGKKVLGLFVTDLEGNRIAFPHASGRFFAKLVTGLIPFAIGYIMAGFTAKKQALHDMIAGCLVLRKL
jgi:uncharacterized RDD family membrane protein YckC